jgi:cyclophilin family peptidyl-prolyl cis-trans isomerase/protein-disulfide isomerase
MKRFGLLLILIALLAVACAPTGGATTVQPTENEETATEVPPPAEDSTPAATADTSATTGEEVEATAAPAGESADDPTAAREDDWRKGNTVNPAVTVIEYADFQCPGCAGFAPLMEQLSTTFPDDVQIIYRHFPLNSIHPNAQKSAEASEAAGVQGKFWEYHTLLFERQGDWSSLEEAEARQFFIDLAAELALDVDQFTAELDEGTHAARVSASEEEAMALGLPGTPSAIVNGQIIAGENLPRDFAAWEAFVREEIKLKDLQSRQYPAAPEMTINQDARYLAHVEMASGDTFTIELLPKSAPQTVNSFVFLARNGWFDNVTFHRVIPTFVAQTGDPSGTGRGGPGYMIPNEIDPNLSHDEAGMVAMANAGPDTNGSQWYVTYGDVSQLDGGYTIFGRVIEGMEVVEALTPRDPSRNPAAPPGDAMKTITIEEILP